MRAQEEPGHEGNFELEPLNLELFRADGRVERAGAQVEIGGNDRYVSLCRKHFSESLRTGMCAGLRGGNR